MKIRISTVICLIAWALYGGYYFGFMAGAKYEMEHARHKLRNAHMIITNGMIEDKEGL